MRTSKDSQTCKSLSKTDVMRSDHQSDLLIACLHAEEDKICSSAGQTALQVGLASYLLCLCVVVIQRLHSVFKQRSLNLETHAVMRSRVRTRTDVFILQHVQQ